MSDIVTELSAEQRDKLLDYGLVWSRIGTSTEEVDMVLASTSIAQAYSKVNIEPPVAFLGPFDNPVECAKAQIMLKRLPWNTDFTKLEKIEIPAGTEFTSEEIYAALDEQAYGSLDSSWLCRYQYLEKELGIDFGGKIDGLVQVAKTCGWWVPYDKVALIQQRPAEIHTLNGLLHNENGPAIKWRGEDRSYDVYAINGEPLLREEFELTHTEEKNEKTD